MLDAENSDRHQVPRLLNREVPTQSSCLARLGLVGTTKSGLSPASSASLGGRTH
jgi:hypothetical protein